MKLSSWVTTNATPRVGSYRCHSSSHRILKKNFIVVIFGVWIFGLLHLTRIQLWLINSLMQQTLFDIWDLLLSKMEDTIAEGFKGRRQLPYAHWITFLMLKAVQVRTPEMVAEYRGATTEFPAYNMAQRIRHSTPQAPSQPRRCPDVPESTAQ